MVCQTFKLNPYEDIISFSINFNGLQGESQAAYDSITGIEQITIATNQNRVFITGTAVTPLKSGGNKQTWTFDSKNMLFGLSGWSKTHVFKLGVITFNPLCNINPSIPAVV